MLMISPNKYINSLLLSEIGLIVLLFIISAFLRLYDRLSPFILTLWIVSICLNVVLNEVLFEVLFEMLCKELFETLCKELLLEIYVGPFDELSFTLSFILSLS